MKMDKDLLPLLNLESTPAFYVKKEDPLLTSPEAEGLKIITESFKKPQEILDWFKGYSPIIEKSTSSVIKKLFTIGSSDKENREKETKEHKEKDKEKVSIHVMNLDKDEIKNKLEEYSQAKYNIERLATDEVNCGLFQVRTRAAKDILVNQINEVMQEILKKINDMVFENTTRIGVLYE